MPDCPTLAEWKPPPNFIDRYDTIKQVNEAVKQINLDEGINYLNIHMHGVKMLRNGPQHKFDTREDSAKYGVKERSSRSYTLPAIISLSLSSIFKTHLRTTQDSKYRPNFGTELACLVLC